MGHNKLLPQMTYMAVLLWEDNPFKYQVTLREDLKIEGTVGRKEGRNEGRKDTVGIRREGERERE